MTVTDTAAAFFSVSFSLSWWLTCHSQPTERHLINCLDSFPTLVMRWDDNICRCTAWAIGRPNRWEQVRDGWRETLDESRNRKNLTLGQSRPKVTSVGHERRQAMEVFYKTQCELRGKHICVFPLNPVFISAHVFHFVASKRMLWQMLDFFCLRKGSVSQPRQWSITWQVILDRIQGLRGLSRAGLHERPVCCWDVAGWGSASRGQLHLLGVQSPSNRAPTGAPLPPQARLQESLNKGGYCES